MSETGGRSLAGGGKRESGLPIRGIGPLLGMHFLQPGFVNKEHGYYLCCFALLCVYCVEGSVIV